MSCATITVGPNDKKNKNGLVLAKENHPRHNPRRLVLVYISFEFDYRSNSFLYSVFLSIPDPLPLGASFSFILSYFLHLHPPRVGQIAAFDPYPISTFQKYLRVVVRLKITIHVSPPH